MMYSVDERERIRGEGDERWSREKENEQSSCLCVLRGRKSTRYMGSDGLKRS